MKSLRETRACLICITHWTFEYIDDLPFPAITEILDAHVMMKTGKKRREDLANEFMRPRERREHPDHEIPPDLPPQFKQQVAIAEHREVAAAHQGAIPVASLPAWMQKGIKEMKAETDAKKEP